MDSYRVIYVLCISYGHVTTRTTGTDRFNLMINLSDRFHRQQPALQIRVDSRFDTVSTRRRRRTREMARRGPPTIWPHTSSFSPAAVGETENAWVQRNVFENNEWESCCLLVAIRRHLWQRPAWPQVDDALVDKCCDMMTWLQYGRHRYTVQRIPHINRLTYSQNDWLMA